MEVKKAAQNQQQPRRDLSEQGIPLFKMVRHQGVIQEKEQQDK